jgi:hypothetical protein
MPSNFMQSYQYLDYVAGADADAVSALAVALAKLSRKPALEVENALRQVNPLVVIEDAEDPESAMLSREQETQVLQLVGFVSASDALMHEVLEQVSTC